MTNETNLLARDVIAAIDRLRHRAALKDEDIQSWVSVVMQRDPERALWHVDRADGVSASSVYGYIAHHKGLYSPFKTARQLDLERLLKSAPQAQNSNTLRGTVMEGVIQRMALETYGGIRLVDGLAQISAQRGIKPCPSLRGNPDDLVSVGGKTCLWDYKSPLIAKDEESDVLSEYLAQLHQYILLAHAAQVSVSRMAIINLVAPADLLTDMAQDLERDLIAKDKAAFTQRQQEFAEILMRLSNMRGQASVRLVAQPIPFDAQLAKDLISAANDADARAMRGEIAPWPQRAEVELDEDARERGRQLQTRMTRVVTLSKALEQESNAIRSELTAIVKDKDIKGKKAPFPMLSIVEKRSLDVPQALAFMDSQKVDPARYMRFGDFDEELVLQLAKSHSVNPDALRKPPQPDTSEMTKIIKELDPEALPAVSTPSYSIGLTRSSKGPAAEAVEKIRAETAGAISALLGDHDPEDLAQSDSQFSVG